MKALRTCCEGEMSPALSREGDLMSQHHPFLPTPAPCGSCPSLQNEGDNLGDGSPLDHCPLPGHHKELLGTGEVCQNQWLWKHPSFASSGEGDGSGDPEAAIHLPSFPGGGVRAESPQDGSLQTQHHHCNGVDLLPLNRGGFRNFVSIF